VRASETSSLSSVVVDVAFTEQLAWIAHAFPGRPRVVIPRHGTVHDAALTDAARAAGVELQLVDVRAPGEAVPAVQAALRKSGAIVLLIPDPVVVTADTIAPLAKTALDARAPLVGFASYFLRVGALAAVSFDTTDMARAALALARADTTGGASGAIVKGPPNAKLVVDGKLAERLGVTVRAGANIEVKR